MRISKALAISAAIALAASSGLYMFFKIHQELDIPQDYAWVMGAVVFLLSTTVMTWRFDARART